jgi:hypothetical protein
MTVIQDLASEMAAYPDEQVQMEIIDFQEPGNVINPGEVCTFRVRIKNKGHLNMSNVSLHVNGTNDLTMVSQTDILGNPINFSYSMRTAPQHISAHSTVTTRLFYMKAIRPTANTRLLEMHLADWDADLGHLLRVHAGHDYGAHAELSRAIVGT